MSTTPAHPPSPTKPLASRDTNTSPTKPVASKKPSQEEDTKNTAKSMDYHRQVLQNRLANEKGGENVYISPSDTIMSPCTKKLNGLKTRRFMKAKPQSLFAKMDAGRKAGAGAGAGGEGTEEEGVEEGEA